MAKGQVIYEEGSEWAVEPGQARVRLTRYDDPDDHRFYVLESWLTGTPDERWDYDAGRNVPFRSYVECHREILDLPFISADSEAIRAAIARYDDYAGRWQAEAPNA